MRTTAEPVPGMIVEGMSPGPTERLRHFSSLCGYDTRSAEYATGLRCAVPYGRPSRAMYSTW